MRWLINQKGFTLVELTISLAVVALLASFTIGRLQGEVEIAKLKKTDIEGKAIAERAYSYMLEKGSFPADYNTLNLYTPLPSLNPFGQAYLISSTPGDITITTYIPKRFSLFGWRIIVTGPDYRTVSYSRPVSYVGDAYYDKKNLYLQ